MPIELGWLDTNIFVHALMLEDPHQSRCRDVLHVVMYSRRYRTAGLKAG